MNNNASVLGRVEELDFLRGVAMILVIIGHCHCPANDWLLAFHMPLFFFITGVDTVNMFINSYGNYLLMLLGSVGGIVLTVAFLKTLPLLAGRHAASKPEA